MQGRAPLTVPTPSAPATSVQDATARLAAAAAAATPGDISREAVVITFVLMNDFICF